MMGTKDLDFLFGVYEKAQAAAQEREALMAMLRAERTRAARLRQILLSMCGMMMVLLALLLWRMA